MTSYDITLASIVFLKTSSLLSQDIKALSTTRDIDNRNVSMSLLQHTAGRIAPHINQLALPLGAYIGNSKVVSFARTTPRATRINWPHTKTLTTALFNRPPESSPGTDNEDYLFMCLLSLFSRQQHNYQFSGNSLTPWISATSLPWQPHNSKLMPVT